MKKEANRKRLEKAIHKLTKTSENISDIAHGCGFNNSSYFSRCFKKAIGVSPKNFRSSYSNIYFLDYYDLDDMLLATKFDYMGFISDDIKEIESKFEMKKLHEPDEKFSFLHEAAIIEYHGVIYTAWYSCLEEELKGYTPICGKRSYDGGKTFTDLEIICEDKNEKIMYCPPVFGICDDKLYMMVNQMVAPDHMHSLDLYVLNNETQKFEFLWSRPSGFKLNTNVVKLPNGKLMLPGRVGELDKFPYTPAVLISDSGKIDAPWRLVKIAENEKLPDGQILIYPEISVMCVNDVLYMFCRNDYRRVSLVYISRDFGETWSKPLSHDIPYVSSKVFAGNLSDGRSYLIANIEEFDRSKLAIYFANKGETEFSKRMILFDKQALCLQGDVACHYPAAFESEGKLYIIATYNYKWMVRGAVLFTIDLDEI